jgi:TatD DNase family protein
MYIDTHCHLNLSEFENEIKDIKATARKAGISNIIVPGVDLDSSLVGYYLAKDDSMIHAAVGFHPNYIQNATLQNIQEITQLIPKNEVVAIGEIGLDYYRHQDSAGQQVQIFEQMLSLSCQEAKPVIIHSRSAATDTLELLNLYKKDGLRGVWHCFEGDWELAEKVLDLGMYLGFCGNITYNDKNAKPDIYEVIKKAPLDKILIETDSPYLTPEPYRGQRNEPAFVVEIAREIGNLRNLTMEEIGLQTSANAVKLFNL